MNPRSDNNEAAVDFEALALSLPEGEFKPTILPITYGDVVFSIIVQGLTDKPVVKRVLGG